MYIILKKHACKGVQTRAQAERKSPCLEASGDAWSQAREKGRRVPCQLGDSGDHEHLRGSVVVSKRPREMMPEMMMLHARACHHLPTASYHPRHPEPIPARIAMHGFLQARAETRTTRLEFPLQQVWERSSSPKAISLHSRIQTQKNHSVAEDQAGIQDLICCSVDRPNLSTLGSSRGNMSDAGRRTLCGTTHSAASRFRSPDGTSRAPTPMAACPFKGKKP